jgi:acylphosphatase
LCFEAGRRRTGNEKRPPVPAIRGPGSTGNNPLIPVKLSSRVKRVRARATGRVQGVGYRYFVTGCAEETGVSGTVRNLPDGSVEIIAEGGVPELRNFLGRCQAAGEPYIRVDRLDADWQEPTREFRSFSVRW